MVKVAGPCLSLSNCPPLRKARRVIPAEIPAPPVHISLVSLYVTGEPPPEAIQEWDQVGDLNGQPLWQGRNWNEWYIHYDLLESEWRMQSGFEDGLTDYFYSLDEMLGIYYAQGMFDGEVLVQEQVE
ncbi:MAG: hypothetical protein ACOYB0_10590 [Polynucleobacter sp.]